MLGHVVERLGHVLQAEIGNAEERDAVLLFHRAGQVDHRAGTLHDVEFCAVGPPDGVHAAVAGDGGHHFHAHPLVVVADHPGLAGQVEVAQDVDAVRADGVGGPGADEPGQPVARRPVAVFLRAAEALAVDRQHVDPFFGLHAAANRGHVVADQADDASGIDEGGVGPVAVDQFQQRRVELLFAAVDHVALAEVRGKAHAVQFRPGARARRGCPRCRPRSRPGRGPGARRRRWGRAPRAIRRTRRPAGSPSPPSSASRRPSQTARPPSRGLATLRASRISNITSPTRSFLPGCFGPCGPGWR